jgi:hypothetical protein
VGIVVLVTLGTLAWIQLSPGPQPTADQPTADLSAAASREAGEATTSSVAVATTAGQASGDGPKNLLANAGF